MALSEALSTSCFLSIKIIEVYNSPQSSKVYKLVQDTTAVLNVLLEVGLPAAIKYILTSRYGIQAGDVRRPLLPLTAESKKNRRYS